MGLFSSPKKEIEFFEPKRSKEAANGIAADPLLGKKNDRRM